MTRESRVHPSTGESGAFAAHDLRTVVTGPDRRVWSEWQRLFDGLPGARIDQHPELVREDVARLGAESERAGYVVEGRGVAGHAAMAVLLTKVNRRIGGLMLFRRLRGFRLAGDRLLGPDDPLAQSEMLRAVVQLMARAGAAFLIIEDVEVGSSFWRALETVSGSSAWRFLPDPAQPHRRILLPATAEEYSAQLSGPTRKKLRRIEREIGPVRLVRVTSAEQVPWFLETARAVSFNSWQYRRLGERVRDDSVEGRRLEWLGRQGALRSYVLLRRDEPVAFEYAVQHRGVVVGEEAGYDLRLREYSPGKVLQALQIRDLFDWNRPVEYDFGKGDAEYKRLFANSTSESASVWLIPRGVRGYATMSWLRLCSSGQRGARRLLTGAGAWGSVRRRFRFTPTR